MSIFFFLATAWLALFASLPLVISLVYRRKTLHPVIPPPPTQQADAEPCPYVYFEEVQLGAPVIIGTAELKARLLLDEWLSPEQRLQMRVLHGFTVRGSLTGMIYVIHKLRKSFNVIREDGLLICFGPSVQLPMSDVLLAQKLALETDERGALVVANYQMALFD